MTDEELRPFIGKMVKATLKCPYCTPFDEQGELRTGGDYGEHFDERMYYLYNSRGVTLYSADNFVNVELLEEIETYSSIEKPPLGLKPKFVWLDERIEEIKAAVNRCFDADYPIQPEWIEEYNELVKSEETK